MFQASSKGGDEILSAEWPAVGPGEEEVSGVRLWELFEEVSERCDRAS
jgi:hypothetical protein